MPYVQTASVLRADDKALKWVEAKLTDTIMNDTLSSDAIVVLLALLHDVYGLKAREVPARFVQATIAFEKV